MTEQKIKRAVAHAMAWTGADKYALDHNLAHDSSPHGWRMGGRWRAGWHLNYHRGDWFHSGFCVSVDGAAARMRDNGLVTPA